MNLCRHVNWFYFHNLIIPSDFSGKLSLKKKTKTDDIMVIPIGRLAQLVKRWLLMVNPGRLRARTQGFKIIQENYVLRFVIVRRRVFLDKDDNPNTLLV